MSRPGRPSARLAVEVLEGRAVPAAGDLDLGFAQGGVAQAQGPTENFGSADDFDIRRLTGRDAQLLPNGDVVVVGRAGFTYGEYFLDRFNRPIYRETVFGGTIQGGPNLNTAADTRDFAAVRLTAGGGRVGTFGANGLARVAVDDAQQFLGDDARAVALQKNRLDNLSDANLIVAGVAGLPVMRGNPQGFPNDFGPQNGPRVAAVTRLGLNGTLDGSFGTAGIRTFRFDAGGTGYSAGVSDVAVYLGVGAAADAGKIVVVSDLQSNPDQAYGTQPRIGFQVARLNPDGSDDFGFGPNQDGRAFVDLGQLAVFSFRDRPARVVIQPDGKIVVAGAVQELNGDLVVARLNADGSPDTAFGTNGAGWVRYRLVADNVANSPLAASTSVGGVAFVPDPTNSGKEAVVVSGGDGRDFFAAKLTAGATGGGALDTTFGTGPVKTGIARVGVDIGGDGDKVDAATGIGVEPNTGKIVLGGRANRRAGGVNSFAAARLLPDGTPDPAFNRGRGRTYDPVGTAVTVGSAEGNANVFVVGGKIVLAGDVATSNGKFLDGRFRPENVDLIALQLQNDNDFNPPPVQPDPPDPSKDPVRTRFAATGAAGQVALLPVGFNDRVNTSALSDLAIIPTALPFGGVYQVATADVDGDGNKDFVVSTGPGAPTRFTVVDGADRQSLLVPPTPVFAGSENFAGGAFASAGDVDGDGLAELVFTPNVGGGPRVTIYSFAGGRLTTRANFFGIADPNFRGGARSAVGDVNGDGKADVLVAAGVGGGPRVALYNGATVFGTNRTKLVNDFFAFDPALRDGVFAAIGDVDGDGKGEVVFGAGAGGAPRVLALSGQALLANGAPAAIASPFANFFVSGDDTARGGARVAIVDLDRDARADVAVGRGDNARVRVYRGLGFTPGGGEPGDFQDVDPFGGTPVADGLFVG